MLLISSALEHREVLCNLLISTHNFIIEKGRYLYISQEQRLYKACNEIEDEIRFLDKCTKYDHLRSQLLNDNRIKSACTENITKPSDLMIMIIIMIMDGSYTAQIFPFRKLNELAQTIMQICTHTYTKNMVCLNLWTSLLRKESFELSFEVREGEEIPQACRQRIPDKMHMSYEIKCICQSN